MAILRMSLRLQKKREEGEERQVELSAQPTTPLVVTLLHDRRENGLKQLRENHLLREGSHGHRSLCSQEHEEVEEEICERGEIRTVEGLNRGGERQQRLDHSHMQVGGTGGEARQQTDGLVTLDQKQMKQAAGGGERHRLGCLQRHDAVPLRRNTRSDVRDGSSRFPPARRLGPAPEWLRSPAPSSECSAPDEGDRAAGTWSRRVVAAPSSLSRSPRVKRPQQTHVQVGRHVFGLVELLVDRVQRVQKRRRLWRRVDSEHCHDRCVVLQCRLQLDAKQLGRESEALLEVEEETEETKRVCCRVHQAE